MSVIDLEAPVRLAPLVYFADGDEVTIGRADLDSYAIFPPDGAAVVRRLEAGESPRQVSEWYEEQYGEPLDIGDLLAALGELELLQDPDDAPVTIGPVRWQRLGRVVFSWPAWVIYIGLILWATVAMVREPDLVPHYQHIFFTEYYTVIEIGLFIGTIPLLLLHEGFHALAGRRLGIRSRLRISHRLYYVVLETALDGLVTVPRRSRVLPILAGLLADVLMLSILTIIADRTRLPGGEVSFLGGLCLAVAFVVLLRIIWQFFFYLRTDLYALITTMLGTVDLHTTARQLLGNRFRRGWRRLGWRWPGRKQLVDEAEWHPVDRRAARWYSWLILGGYTVSIATFLLAALPVVYQMFAGALGRLFGSGAGWDGLLDSFVFVALNVQQVALTIWLAARERRQRRQARLEHVIN